LFDALPLRVQAHKRAMRTSDLVTLLAKRQVST
jgi:hypothetical protein